MPITEEDGVADRREAPTVGSRDVEWSSLAGGEIDGHGLGTLLAHGRVRRGYLGVGAQPVRLPADLAEELGQETGLLLVSVEPDGPAGQGGLLLGDTIVALDGQPVRHMDELLALLGGDRVGKKLSFNMGSPLTAVWASDGGRRWLREKSTRA